MDWSGNIIPAIIIIFANLFGGKHGSNRYEIISASFYWLGATCLILVFISGWFFPSIQSYFIQTALFLIITALARDFEKLLKPLFNKTKD